MIKIVIIADKNRLSDLSSNLQAVGGISVLFATHNIAEAKDIAEQAQVIILDIDQQSAKSFISSFSSKKIPIIAVVDRAGAGFNLMESGAAEMQLRGKGPPNLYFCKVLAGKIRSAAQMVDGHVPRQLKRTFSGNIDKFIVIGSSTGGTETLEYILRQMPEDIPPILIVQHMPPIFTRMFAQRLHEVCRVSVWEARSGDALKKGLVLIAPGDYHMVLKRDKGGLCVDCIGGARVCSQRPSVDVLFESVAKTMGQKESRRVLGVILTGMGSDGANGLLAMRNMGSQTIGQDEATCIVYGMPRAAYERGAVERQLPMDKIAPALLDFMKT